MAGLGPKVATSRHAVHERPGAAVNITVFSYGGGAHVGINADRGAIGDTDLLRESLLEGFAEVLAVK